MGPSLCIGKLKDAIALDLRAFWGYLFSEEGTQFFDDDVKAGDLQVLGFSRFSCQEPPDIEPGGGEPHPHLATDNPLVNKDLR